MKSKVCFVWSLTTLLTLGAILTGCATSRATYVASKRYPSRGKTCDLQIMNLPPKKDYIELARIDARGGATLFEGSDLKSMLPEMKEKACRLGAHALIITQVSEGGLNFFGPKTAGNASGIAIRYEAL